MRAWKQECLGAQPAHDIGKSIGGERFTSEARKACPHVATPAACLRAAKDRLLPANGTSAAWELQNSRTVAKGLHVHLSAYSTPWSLPLCSRRPTSTLPSTEQALHPPRKE